MLVAGIDAALASATEGRETTHVVMPGLDQGIHSVTGMQPRP